MLVLLLAGTLLAHADEPPTLIAKSADGQFEIRAADAPAEGLFGLEIREVSSGRLLAEIEGLYPVKYGTENIVYWHPKRPLLALRTYESRRFGRLRLLRVEKDQISEVIVPDYASRALAYVNGTEPTLTGFVGISGWEEDLLRFEFVFDSGNLNSGDDALYTSEVVLRIPAGAAAAEMVSVGKPNAQ